MHELGVVFYIIRDVKEVAAENNASHISKVVLNVGEVSAVIPEYLQDCWNWAVGKEELMTGCELEIRTVPAVTYCESCGNEYPTVQHGKICPYCHSPRTYLLRGNEFEIQEINVIE